MGSGGSGDRLIIMHSPVTVPCSMMNNDYGNLDLYI